MRFWDASAIVPLLVDQVGTPAVTDEYERDPDLVVWWATRVEAASAIARLEREGALSALARLEADDRGRRLETAWQEVEPTERVRRMAMRLLRVHSLRSADALVLAAAIVAAEAEPGTLPFVTLDDRLAGAADREGFPVVRPG